MNVVERNWRVLLGDGVVDDNFWYSVVPEVGVTEEGE
jgi:hypothetical protein